MHCNALAARRHRVAVSVPFMVEQIRGEPRTLEPEPSNKGMKLTSAERIKRSQLIPGVGRT
jgi:hypothetical protein